MIAWHLIEDVLGWVGVLTAALVMMFFEAPYIDPVLSILFILITLWNVTRLLKQTLKLFLQGVPSSFDINQIESKIMSLKGIDSVHDTHLWSMDGDNHILTTHVVVDDSVEDSETSRLKNLVRHIVREMRVNHATIEMERKGEQCHYKNC